MRVSKAEVVVVIKKPNNDFALLQFHYNIGMVSEEPPLLNFVHHYVLETYTHRHIASLTDIIFYGKGTRYG